MYTRLSTLSPPVPHVSATRIAFVVAILFWVFGDLYTTRLAISHGAVEANPVGRVVLHTYGYEGAFVIKLGTLALVEVHRRLFVWIFAHASADERGRPPRYFRIIDTAHPTTLAVLGIVLSTNNLLVFLSLTP